MYRSRGGLFSRILACVLAVVLVVGPLAESVPPATAAPVSGTATQSPAPDADPSEDMPDIVKEIVEERTADSRQFLLEDGNVRAEYFAEPIHYKDEKTGDYKKIDKDLVKEQRKGKEVLVNEANSFDIELPVDLSGGSVTLSKQEVSVSMRPMWNGSRNGARLGNGRPRAKASSKEEVEYADAFANATLKYESLPGGLKETIVVPKRVPENTYSFLLETEGLTPSLQADGSIILVDTAGETEITIPAPFMWDSAAGKTGPAFSDSVHYRLAEQGKAYRLDVVADRAWLDDPSRVYPVFIDPTLYAEGTPLDTYVSNRPGFLDTVYAGSNFIWLNSGNPTANWTEYGLIKLPVSLVSDLAAKKATGHEPLEGRIWLFHASTAVPGEIIAKRHTGDINIGTTTWNNFQNLPKPEPIPSNTPFTVDEGWWNGPDITSALQYWQQNGTQQCTIHLETSPGAHFAFKSVERNQERPLVSIYYARPPQVTLSTSSTETILPQVRWNYTGDAAQDRWEIQVAESPGMAPVSSMSGTGTVNTRNITAPQGGWKYNNPYFVRVRTSFTANINFLPVWSAWTEWQQFTPVLPTTRIGATTEWFTEVDSNGDGIPDTPNDAADRGRGWVDLSWPACIAATGYQIFLHDGHTYRQVASVPATVTTWSTRGRGLFPSDSSIASLSVGTTSNQFGLSGGLDLRDDPRPLYAKTAGTALDGLAAYSFKVLPTGTSAAVTLSNMPDLLVSLDNRTLSAERSPADTDWELGPVADHDARAILDDGTFAVSVTDLQIASHGPSARLSRSYDSGSVRQGLFGPGWRFNFEQSIQASAGVADYVDETGEVYRFRLRGGAWVPPNGYHAELTSVTAGGGPAWRLAFRDGAALTFDHNGALTQESDQNGNVVSYTRTPSQLAIRAANGQAIVVGLDGGRVTGAVYSTADGTRSVTYSSLSTQGASTVGNSVTYHPGTSDSRTVNYTYKSSAVPDTFHLSGLAVQEVPDAAWTFSASPRLDTWSRGGSQLGAISWSATRSATVTRLGAQGTASTFENVEWNPTGTVAGRSEARFEGGALHWTTYGYGPDGQITRQTDALGGVQTWTYDARGNLVSETDPDGARTRYTYGTSGGSRDRVVQEISPSGSEILRSYDASGNMLVQEQVLNVGNQRARTSWTYDVQGRVTREERAITATQSAATTFGDFAPSGDARIVSNLGVRLSSNPASAPVGITEMRSYDAFGNLLSRTDGMGVIVENNQFSPAGRQVRSTDASNTSQVTFYDALGRVIRSQREAGTQVIERVINTYDGFGNLIREDHVASGVPTITVAHVVDPRGWVTQSAHSIEGTTRRQYDASGRIVTEWAADRPETDLLSATRTRYDALGRTIASIAPGSPDASATTTAYSPGGDVLRTQDADGTWTRFVYDVAGNRVTETRPVEGGTNTVTDVSAYDLAGRLITSIKAVGTEQQAVTSLAYDLLGRQVSGQLGQPSTTVHNTLSQVLSMTDFDGIVTTTAYDRAGRVTSQTVGGRTTTTDYDGLGRIVRTTDPAGRTARYVYDAFGRVTQETHFAAGGAQIRRTDTAYDALSRPVTVTEFLGSSTTTNVVTAFTYATAANRASSAIITHAGLTTNITYDAHGRETTRAVTAAGVNLRSAVTSRNAEGRRVASTVASLSASASFDAAGKLTAQTGPGLSATYTYDVGTGRKVAETVAVTGVAAVTSAYAYSESGRLVSARTGATQRTYSFDERGNLGVVTTGTERTTLLFDGDDRLTTSTVGPAVTSYRYDSLGRRSRQASGSVITTYTWDPASRLTGWQRGTSNATYSYDAAGQRTRAVVTRAGATTTTNYVYDGIVLRSLVATGVSNWRLAYLYDEEGRPYAGVYTSGTADPVTFLIATNDRGDVVALTNMEGGRFAHYTYDPYGNVLSQSTNATGSITAAVAAAIAERQPLRYAGYVYDAHSQTYYLSQRHYDPATMRFLSKDPIRADGEESAYQYAAGDPVGKVDPTGLVAIPLGAAPWFVKLPAVIAIPGVGWVAIGVLAAAVGVWAIVKHGVPWAIERYTWVKYRDRIEGQIRTASTHVRKLDTAKGSDPNGYNRNRNKWKGEVRTALREARRLAERHLRGKTRERILQRIRSLEGQVNRH